VDPAMPGEVRSSVDPELRRRAEGLLRGQARDTEPATVLEASALLHEVRVREVEVEMQNEELRRVQEELGASRTKYLELFDLAPVGYLTLSEEGSIRDANSAAARLLGVEQSQLAGRSLTGFVLPADRDLYYRHRSELTGTGQPRVCELRLADADADADTGADREVRWIRLEESVIESEDAEGALSIAALSDITGSKAAEESRARLAAIVDSSDDAILTKTLDGTVTSWNAGAERLYGYAPEEVVGRNVSLLTPPGAQGELAGLLDRLRRGDPVAHYEAVRVRKDGAPVEVSLSMSPIRDATGAIVGASTIARDVGARHRAEQALHESEERYTALFANMLDGYAYCRTLYDEDGRPDDFVYLQVNPAFTRLTGLTDVVGKRFQELFPTGRDQTPDPVEVYGTTAKTGVPAEFDIDFAPLNMWLHISVFRPEPDHFVAVFADVSEKERAEAALRASEARFRGYFEQSLIGATVTSPEKGWVEVNEATCALFGYSREELAHLTWADLTHPDDLAADIAQFERVMAGEIEGYRLEKRFLRKDGGVVDVDMSVRCERKPDGSVDYFLALLADVTEARRAAQANALLGRAIDVHRDAAFWTDADDRFTYVNEAACAMLGYSREELIGQPVGLVNPVVTPERMASVWERLRREGSLVSESVHRRKDGSELPVDVTMIYVSFAGHEYNCGFARDITEPKAAEEALRASNEKYRTLFESMAQGVVYQDAGGHITAANPAAERILGLTLAQMQGVTSTDPRWRTVREDGSDFPGEEHPAMVALRTGRPAEGVVCGVFNPADDACHWVKVGAVPQFRPGEEAPYQVFTTFEDVTEIRATAEALRQRETIFRSIVEQARDSIGLVDVATGRFVEFNDAACCNLGYSREEFAALGLADIDLQWPGEGIVEALAALQATGTNEFETRHRCKDGGVRDVRVSATMVDVAGRALFAGIWSDITERKQAGQQIVRLNDELEERVASRTAQLEASNKELEAFVYSAAHDLRAPLRAIDGFSQMVVDDAGEKLTPDDHEHLQRVRAAAQRMALLIDALMGLARASRQEMLIEEVDVSALAAGVLTELAEAEPGRAVVAVVAPGLTARADTVLLRVVLANLLDNAWKFTGKHESARIEVGVTDAGGERAFYVRDDGAGFDPAYAAHLFGAFQRMHQAGLFEGDGIGLATVQRLVTRHGGRVWAEAAVEKGATFYFTLPGVDTGA